jgi:outer membrane protein W
MKTIKILTALLSLFVVINGIGQDYSFKRFKVDLAAGYGIPEGFGSKAGAILALEPKYALTDNITVGLRFEAAVLSRVLMDVDGNYFEDGDVSASASYLATTDYYFNTNKFRPFLGLGAGVFRSASANLSGGTDETLNSSHFGFMPRAGFEWGHFRTAIEYDLAGKTGEFSNNYLGIKIGFFFGGGRK